MDYCPDGDLSPSYYDGTCEAEIVHPSPDTFDNGYSQELNEAYQWAKNEGIIDAATIEDADML